MHGLSFAAGIVKTVEESIKSHTGAEVVEIKVEMSSCLSIDAEELKYCFEIAAKGTSVEGAKLVISEVPAKLRCLNCGSVIELSGAQCRCGSASFAPFEEGVLVKDIRIEVKEHP